MTHGHEQKVGECGWEGVHRAEGNKGGKWDNCNSIINKIYFKKISTMRSQFLKIYNNNSCRPKFQEVKWQEKQLQCYFRILGGNLHNLILGEGIGEKQSQ